MLKGAVLSVSEKKELFLVTSHQNIANHLPLLFKKATRQHCTDNILIVKSPKI
jgi:hypothetical protein